MDSLEKPRQLNFNLYFYVLGLKIKKELVENNLVNTVADVNYVNGNLFNYPNDKLNFKLKDENMNMLEKFDKWIDNLTNYKSSSKDYCKRDIRKVLEISIKNNLGDFTAWNENDWSSNESLLRNLPEILDNNSPKGSGWYSASLSKFKEFLSSNDSDVLDIPKTRFEKFGWRWATTGISSKLNLPVSLFAVLDAILYNGNGSLNQTSAFKKTLKTICENKYEIDDDDLVKTLTRENNPKVEKNIIENSGNYWRHLDLINPSGKNAVVTELGKQDRKSVV
jgi:hypothetical protein